ARARCRTASGYRSGWRVNGGSRTAPCTCTIGTRADPERSEALRLDAVDVQSRWVWVAELFQLRAHLRSDDVEVRVVDAVPELIRILLEVVELLLAVRVIDVHV